MTIRRQSTELARNCPVSTVASAASKKPQQIDQRTLKLLVGLIAIFLANVCSFFAVSAIDSISASYVEGGWARDFFVGSLFAISAFLVAYNGVSTLEKYISKIAAMAAMGVALFPCDCVNGIVEEGAKLSGLTCGQLDAMGRASPVHYVAAATLFIVLTIFCRIFYKRAKDKKHKEAILRMRIYATCGAVMIASIAFMATGSLLHTKFGIPRFTFQGERAGLIAFGISWLTASKVLPGLSSNEERLKLFKGKTPEGPVKPVA
ncbi:hypothetical protein [Pseudomonas moorei]|uniref:DUF998 domain-containing protein n=1 Tax=Pseudomonas moorei TaxID=395599 RepID=A0A1H1EIP3_9PSED|nr:hypothetical protein [Pseudomonas moorei]KAB0507753.1 hypothetical protein F7R06_06260 [Pseudomonas moorei]SDQ88665.1 hypothetical protein SAMN04490195_2219 [Pseudomonas moorei]